MTRTSDASAKLSQALHRSGLLRLVARRSGRCASHFAIAAVGAGTVASLATLLSASRKDRVEAAKVVWWRVKPPSAEATRTLGCSSVCRDLLEPLPALLAQGRVVEAAKNIDHVERLTTSSERVAEEDSSETAWASHQLRNNVALAETIQTVKRQAARVANVRAALIDDDGWLDKGYVYGFRVLTKGSGAYGEYFTLRVEGNVDVPICDLLVLLHEVDLWMTWSPSLAGMGLRSASYVAEASPVRKLLYVTSSLPWPLQNRDLAFAADVMDCMEELDGHPPQLLILVDSAEASTHFPEELSKCLPAEGPLKRVNLVNSAIVMTPVDASKTKLQVMMTAKIDMVLPQWLLHLGVNTMSGLVLHCMCRQASTLHDTPAYRERLPQLSKHPFYALLLPRLTND